MKYVNQINILLAGVGVVVVIYTFAITFFAAQPTELIWVEPGSPGADLESTGRRLSGSDTSTAFRSSATTQTSAVETLPTDRGRTRPGFQTSQPAGSAGPRAGFARSSSPSPSRSFQVQQPNELNRTEVGRTGGVIPNSQIEQFGHPTPPVTQPSRIGEMSGQAETLQPQPAEGVKRDASTDPPPPPVRSSRQ